MDYINPTSIAGMYNVPKDNSLPGAGHGLLQGYLEGQAANRANEFLEMSKMGQAQDYAKNQFLNQKAWQMAPLEMQAKRLGNEHTQAQISESKINQEKALELIKKLQYEGKLDKFIAASQFLGPFQKANTDLARRGAVEQYNYFMRQMDPKHEDYSWDGRPDSWNKLVSDVGMAGELAKISREFAQKTALQDAEYGYKGRLQANQLSSNERIAGMETEARRYAADRAASREGRGPTAADLNADIDRRVVELMKIEPDKRTREQNEELAYYKAIRSGAVESTIRRTDPNVVGEGARARAENETVGAMTGLDKAKLEMRAAREGITLDWDNFTYRVNPDTGKIQSKPRPKN